MIIFEINICILTNSRWKWTENSSIHCANSLKKASKTHCLPFINVQPSQTGQSTLWKESLAFVAICSIPMAWMVHLCVHTKVYVRYRVTANKIYSPFGLARLHHTPRGTTITRLNPFNNGHTQHHSSSVDTTYLASNSPSTSSCQQSHRKGKPFTQEIVWYLITRSSIFWMWTPHITR